MRKLHPGEKGREIEGKREKTGQRDRQTERERGGGNKKEHKAGERQSAREERGETPV